jgi:hypothetical protein
MHLAKEIFSLFEGELDRGYNVGKCQVMSIRCSAEQVEHAVAIFPCQAVPFLI